jgi:hypothetical protein
MGEEKQSQGRNENDAIPADQWPSKGLADRDVADAAAEGSQGLTGQPYGADEDARQRQAGERTGRTEEVGGEQRSFRSGDNSQPDPNDLQGPAGDPAEGKRPGGDSYPA